MEKFCIENFGYRINSYDEGYRITSYAREFNTSCSLEFRFYTDTCMLGCYENCSGSLLNSKKELVGYGRFDSTKILKIPAKKFEFSLMPFRFHLPKREKEVEESLIIDMSSDGITGWTDERLHPKWYEDYDFTMKEYRKGPIYHPERGFLLRDKLVETLKGVYPDYPLKLLDRLFNDVEPETRKMYEKAAKLKRLSEEIQREARID